MCSVLGSSLIHDHPFLFDLSPSEGLIVLAGYKLFEVNDLEHEALYIGNERQWKGKGPKKVEWGNFYYLCCQKCWRYKWQRLISQQQNSPLLQIRIVFFFFVSVMEWAIITQASALLTWSPLFSNLLSRYEIESTSYVHPSSRLRWWSMLSRTNLWNLIFH